MVVDDKTIFIVTWVVFFNFYLHGYNNIFFSSGFSKKRYSSNIYIFTPCTLGFVKNYRYHNKKEKRVKNSKKICIGGCKAVNIKVLNIRNNNYILLNDFEQQWWNTNIFL